MNAWIKGTSGTMPLESKYCALEERGVKRFASPCEPPSVGIGIDDECRISQLNVMVVGDRRRCQERVDVKEGVYVTQSAQYMHGVNLSVKSVVTLREKSTRTQL